MNKEKMIEIKKVIKSLHETKLTMRKAIDDYKTLRRSTAYLSYLDRKEYLSILRVLSDFMDVDVVIDETIDGLSSLLKCELTKQITNKAFDDFMNEGE